MTSGIDQGEADKLFAASLPNSHYERLLCELINADRGMTLSELARRVGLQPRRAGRYSPITMCPRHPTSFARLLMA